MINFKLHHYQSGTYKNPHFFILSKGLDTGKPLKEPTHNCFVIELQCTSDCEDMEAICNCLWKDKYWHRFFIGSIVPYIGISEFCKYLALKSCELMDDFEEHKKDVKTLKMLLEKEDKLQENMNLINDLRRAILHRYCKN